MIMITESVIEWLQDYGYNPFATTEPNPKENVTTERFLDNELPYGKLSPVGRHIKWLALSLWGENPPLRICQPLCKAVA